MNESVLIKIEFTLWVMFSIVLPVGIYSYLLWKKAISRMSVLAFGVTLIAISGVTVFLLQRLAELAKQSPALFDDRIFASELSVALYLLPAVFAGIGVNAISHVLVSHLAGAEKAFDQAVKNSTAPTETRSKTRPVADLPMGRPMGGPMGGPLGRASNCGNH